MIKNILVLFFISFISCQQKSVSEKKITATCEKIIVQDTTDTNIIHFLVSFHNPNKEDVLIFANSCSKGYQSKNYTKMGLYLKNNKIETPLGQFNSSVFFRIKAQTSFKILYTYNEIYPNKKINFKGTKNIESTFKNVELYYKSDTTIIDSLSSKKQSDVILNISNFKVDMSKTAIEFKKYLNIEEAIKLVDGEIIKGK